MRGARPAAAAAIVVAVAGGALAAGVASDAKTDAPGTAKGAAAKVTTPKALKGNPTPGTTGVPKGWKPKRTVDSEVRITKSGSVVQDLLVRNANIIVDAPNVTLRRVKLQGGRITNYAGPRCQGRMRILDSTIEPAPGRRDSVESEGVIDAASYTAQRVKIWRRSEGFRVTGTGYPGCGPVRIQDSFIKIVIPEGRCDLHADGIQGYGGPHTIISNVTIDFYEAACGTAPVFIPKDQGNTTAEVDRLLVMGGGYPFRMGVPGTVKGLKVVNKSWEFGPIDVACSLVRRWDAKIVTITKSYQVKRTLRRQRCNTESGT